MQILHNAQYFNVYCWIGSQRLKASLKVIQLWEEADLLSLESFTAVLLFSRSKRSSLFLSEKHSSSSFSSM